MRAFTLIECIIVVSIICVLAAILLPICISARNRSKETSAIESLAQIGKTLSLYTSDYDDQLPFASGNNCFHLAVDLGRACSNLSVQVVARSVPANAARKPYGSDWQLFRSPVDTMDRVLASEPGHKATWFDETTTARYPGSSYEYTRLGLQGVALSSFRQSENGVPFHSMYPLGDGPSAMRHLLFADLHTVSGNRLLAPEEMDP